MSQGKFHLHHPSGGSKAYAQNPFHGTAPGQETKSASLKEVEDQNSANRPLLVEDLKAEVLATK